MTCSFALDYHHTKYNDVLLLISGMPSAGDPSDALRTKSPRDYLKSLLEALDSLCFIEIAICYYSDNSLLLLCARSFVQVLIVQARAELLAASAPLVPVLTANIICVASHLLHSSPAATSRSARGYLHGGLIIVFEGQLGPISKWRLLLQDVIICAIQLLILSVSYERQVLASEKKEAPPQDLEAAEEGRVRTQDTANEEPDETAEGIEMQSLLPESGKTAPASAATQDDLILTLNIRRSLSGSMSRSQNSSTAESTANTASASAMSLRAIVSRIAAQRAAAGT